MHENEIAVIEGAIERFWFLVEHYYHPESVPLAATVAVTDEPVPFADGTRLDRRPVEEGASWADPWQSGWFRLEGTAPEAWAGRRVVAQLDFGGEACVFDEDGEPRYGLTSSSVFLIPFVRDRYPLFDACRGGEAVALWVEAAANHIGGVPITDGDPTPRPASGGLSVGTLQRCRLAVFEEEIFELWLDVTVLKRLMEHLPKRDPWRARLRRGLARAAETFRYDAPNPAEVRALLAPLLATKGGEERLRTQTVGHAHIDTAWLWPMRETIRKCARTFSTQLDFTERAPGYVFGASQAQHYAFVKQHYPGLYERIRQAIADGRWEVQGAMWVEADCNLPSGESLARQIVYGKHFFEDEFGVDVRNLWLPDVFGYSAALPQLLRKAGVPFFVTQKLSWNQVNVFPHHTFRWRGIDGSEVTVHFPPENNYNAQLYPDRQRFAAENFAEADRLPSFLTLFGIGDGGGGPTETHIGFGLRQTDLAACPRIEFGPAQPLLDAIGAEGEVLDVWEGELYLEAHRGTLTTQARNKAANRRLELRLRRMEMLAASGALGQYPGTAFRDVWRTVLTNQFHDIIPGSSIERVYQDTAREYEALNATLDGLETDWRAAAVEADGDALTLVNTLSHPFRGMVRLPDANAEALAAEGGDGAWPVQPAAEGGAWAWAEIPGLASRVCMPATAPAAPPAGAATAEELTLENDLVRYRFDADGRLVEAWDKEAERSILAPDAVGNALTLYQDWPAKWDAWDIDSPYRTQVTGTAKGTAHAVAETGPLVAALRFDLAVGKSALRQTVRLAAGSRRLDFVTEADWNETRQMLRVAFPVDIRADHSSSEIQFGLCRRPTHDNTSWERARFEVCAHRFADLSEHDYGVALLNDCKYGHYLKENVLDLNLLRSPYYPDKTADRGAHRFTYSLLPHPGPLEESTVAAEAHVLNQPPVVLDGRWAGAFPVRPDGLETVVVDTVKKAEREDALVVRCYEAMGRRATATLAVDPAWTEAHEADLLERAETALPIEDGRLRLAFGPFEVKTLLLRRD